MKWLGILVALMIGSVLDARAQQLPNPAALEEELGSWHVDDWATARVAQNRGRCRNAVTGRLRVYVLRPHDLEYWGAQTAQGKLFGDDYDIVGLVQFVDRFGSSSRLTVWCEFEPDGAFKNIRLSTRP